MEPHEYTALARVEDTHPWFCYRRALVDSLVRRFAPRWPPGAVLDAGCGTGANLLRWATWGASVLVGIDIDGGALRHCRSRVPRAFFMRADLRRIPLSGCSFDVIVSTDVIEHIEDDIGVLRELHRLLRPRGILVLTTPAYRAAYSHHDRHLEHVRRYDVVDLARSVARAGLNVLYWTRFNVLPALPLLLYRKFVARPGRSDVGKPLPPLAEVLLSRIWRLEAALASRVQLPVGMTHVLVLGPHDIHRSNN